MLGFIVHLPRSGSSVGPMVMERYWKVGVRGRGMCGEKRQCKGERKNAYHV